MGFWKAADIRWGPGRDGVVNHDGSIYPIIHQWDRKHLLGAGIAAYFERNGLRASSGYGTPKPAVQQVGDPAAVRPDGRCWKKFKAPDGSKRPGECSAAGRNGGGPECCNVNNGYCGDTPAHCTCPGCIRYLKG